MFGDLLKPAFSALASAARPLLSKALLTPFRSLFSAARAGPLSRMASVALTPGPGTLRHRTRLLQAYDTTAKGDVERVLTASPPPVEQAPQGPTLQRGVWLRDSIEKPDAPPPLPPRRTPMPSVTLPPVPRAPKLLVGGGKGVSVPQALPRPGARGGRRWLIPVPQSAYAPSETQQTVTPGKVAPTPPRRVPTTPEGRPRSSAVTSRPQGQVTPTSVVKPTVKPTPPPKPPRLQAPSLSPKPVPQTPTPTGSLGPSGGTRMRALAMSGVLGAPMTSGQPGPSLGRGRSQSTPSRFGRMSLGAPLVMLGGAVLGGSSQGSSQGSSGTERGLMASRELSQRLDATFSRRSSAPPVPSFLDQSRTLSDRLDEVARSVKPKGPLEESGAARNLRESRELSDRLDEALVGLKGKAPTESTASKHLRESRELSDRLTATLGKPDGDSGPTLTKSQQDMQATRELSDRLDGAFRKPDAPSDGLTDTARDLQRSRQLSDRLGGGLGRGRSGMSRLVPLTPLLGGSPQQGGTTGGSWVGGSKVGLTRGSGPQLGKSPQRPTSMRDDTPQVVLPEGLKDVPLPQVDPDVTFDDLQRGDTAWRRRQHALGLGFDEYRRRARKGGVSPSVEQELVTQFERVLEQRELAPLVRRDPRAKARFEQLSRELDRESGGRLSVPGGGLTPGGPVRPQPSGSGWVARRKPSDDVGSQRQRANAMIGRRTASSRKLTVLDEQETVAKTQMLRDYRDRAEDRLREDKTVLADVLAGDVTEDDLTENRDLRRYLIADLVLKKKKFGRLEPEEDKLERRWNEGLGLDDEDDEEEEPTIANAPSDLALSVKPHWVAGSMLARRARSAWWPTWVKADVAPIEGARLARRFAGALRMVELRALPTLSGEERSELQSLQAAEDRALRFDGSTLVLDRVLGRRSLKPHELPSGYGGSEVRLSQTDEGLAKQLKRKKGSVSGGGQQVLLSSGKSAPQVGGGDGVTSSRRMRGKLVGRVQRGNRKRSNAVTERAVTQATQRGLDGGPPPGFPVPDGGFVRGGVDDLTTQGLSTSRSRGGQSGLDQLDRLDDEGLARLLAAVLADPDVGGRVLERALSTLDARARLGRMREIRG